MDQETRPETIARWTILMMQETRITWPVFATNVIARYYARTPKPARRIEFKTVGEVFAVAKVNGTRLERMVKPGASSHLWSELEESWVMELPGRYYIGCRRDLARRYDLLDVQLPSSAPNSDPGLWAALSRSFASSIEAVVPVLADHVINEKDERHLPGAIEVITQHIAAAEGLRARMIEELAALDSAGKAAERGS
ncbi:hypothetical protein [Hydrocarboniphaga sp.]|uniref:hypothetical protein n=1 Tax=Hydrocarboniphaga sp. TaxID=2033016 RepID=UPI003D0DBFF1